MELLLAILSGLALWVLLAVLVALLGRIRAALASINATLAKIAMGVRAIERETAILSDVLPGTATTLTQVADHAALIASRLASAENRLAEATR